MKVGNSQKKIINKKLVLKFLWIEFLKERKIDKKRKFFLRYRNVCQLIKA